LPESGYHRRIPAILCQISGHLAGIQQAISCTGWNLKIFVGIRQCPATIIEFWRYCARFRPSGWIQPFCQFWKDPAGFQLTGRDPAISAGIQQGGWESGHFKNNFLK
jgi:hypothetical protein